MVTRRSTSGAEDLAVDLDMMEAGAVAGEVALDGEVVLDGVGALDGDGKHTKTNTRPVDEIIHSTRQLHIHSTHRLKASFPIVVAGQI